MAEGPRRPAGGQRWNQATPVLVLTLLFCSATFIVFQVLVTRSTLSQGGQTPAASAGRRTTEEPQRAERVLRCLRALDTELRALVYQRIPSVERFASSFWRAAAARRDARPDACDCGDGDAAQRRVLRLSRHIQQLQQQEAPACTAQQQPSTEELQAFYGANGSQHWRPEWTEQPLAGGRHSPGSCRPDKSVLVLVPYRQRERHLRSLLRHLHPILQAQRLCYTLVVGEQHGNATFNKAKLMNAVFLESYKLNWFDCVIFHDVDLLPTNPYIPYACPVYPRHLSVSVDKFGYALPYKQLVGGVLAMPVRHFLKVNGYSNLFWGWGGEDDDMETRIRSAGLLVTRPHPLLARYRMIRHGARKEILDEVRYKLLYLSSKRYRLDGLNSLNYSLVSVTRRPLYTHIVVDIGQSPRSADFY